MLRKKGSLTQLQLSEALPKRGVDVDRAGIAKVENGLRGVLDYELVALASVLRIPVGRLLGVRVPKRRSRA
ncbi:hypothetical protein ACFLSJ_01120 [Verrucomicrobiota bacterium]